MPEQRHGQDTTELTSEAEARIRADERRKVLAERDASADDWRTTPPSADEPRVTDPSAAETGATTFNGDPRGWDVPDHERGFDERTPAMHDDDRMAMQERERMAMQERERIAMQERERAAMQQRMGTRDDDRVVMQEDPRLAMREDRVHDDTVTERGFSPGQILIVLAGAASLALGIWAVARTGLDGSLSDPVEPVLGWDHTALLGLFEIGAGVLLILSGLRAGARWLGGLVGVAMIVGGALILGQLDWTVDELGAERDFGWVPIVIGAVAVIGAAIPRVRRTRRVSTASTYPTDVH